MFANFLAIGMIIAAVPRYSSETLGASKALVGLASTSFFVAALLVRPVAGRLLDRFGRRPFLRWPLVALTVLALSLFAAHSIWAVAVMRFVQGAVGSTFYTAAAAATTDLAPPDRKASAIARISVAIYLGFALGPAIGEVLFDRSPGWVWFGVAVMHGIALVIVFGLPETRVAPAALAPVVPSPTPALAGGVEPAVISGGSRWIHPAVVLPGVVLGAIAVGYTSITTFSPLYAREVGLPSSGPLYATFALSVMVVRAVSGRLADRRGHVAVALPGAVAVSAGLALLALVQQPAAAFVGVALAGLGFGLTFPALTVIAVDRAPDAERGAALGSFLAFNDLGQGAGGPLVGAVVDRWGFGWGYGVPSLLAAGAATVLVRGFRVRPRVAAPSVTTPDVV